MVKPAIKLQAYKALALHPDNLAPKFPKRDAEDEGRMLEKRFWSALGTQAMRAPLYAADVSRCSLFDDAHDARPWDMRNLDTLLQRSIAPVEVACAPPRPQPAPACYLLPAAVGAEGCRLSMCGTVVAALVVAAATPWERLALHCRST